MPDTMTLIYDSLLHETSPGEPDSGAVLLDFGGREEWIPKSQIENYPEFMDCDSDGVLRVEIKTWFVLDKGLEEFEA